MDEVGIITRTIFFFLCIPVGTLIFAFQKGCWFFSKMCFNHDSWGVKIQGIPCVAFSILPPFLIFSNASKKDIPEIIVSYILGVILWYYLYGDLKGKDE